MAVGREAGLSRAGLAAGGSRIAASRFADTASVAGGRVAVFLGAGAARAAVGRA